VTCGTGFGHYIGMKARQVRPISAVQEGRIKDLRRVANCSKGVFDPKRTCRLHSYKDLPRFRIEDLYKGEMGATLPPPSPPKRSRPSSGLPRPSRPDYTLELRSETFDKDMIISSFAVTQARNPNTNHNNAVIVASASFLRKRLHPALINRGVSGMSITSTLTSPGRLHNKYSVPRQVVDVPSIYR